MKRLIFILSILFLTIVNVFSQDLKKATLYADYLKIKSGYEEWNSPGVEGEVIEQNPVKIVVNVNELLVRIYNKDMDVFSLDELISNDTYENLKIVIYVGKDLKGEIAEIDMLYDYNSKRFVIVFDYIDNDNPDFIYSAPLETVNFEYFNNTDNPL